MLSGRKCSNLLHMKPAALSAPWFRKHALLIWLAILPIFPLWRAVFLGQAIGPYDEVRQMAPWNGPRPEQPWDVLPVDGAIQFSAWRDLVFQSWGRGEPPFWNPYQLAGTPLLANSQSGALYPPHILVGLLHVPTFLAITILAWFHLALAGLGVYFLTRRLGGTPLGSAIAGSSFSVSAFMLAWTALPSVISTVAWIPWVLAFTWTLTKDPLRLFSLGLAVSVAMMLLAGHLQFAAYGLIAAGIFAVCGIAINRSPRAVVSLALGLIAGLALAAPHILPVLQYSQFSHRKNTPSMAGYEGYVNAGALKPFELGTLPWATLQGDPRAESSRSESVNHLPSYWPGFVKQGANFAESAVGVGPLVLGLACFAPWRKRETWVVAGVGLISILIALGTPLNMILFFGVPGWSSTGSLARIIVLAVMMLCVAAGLGASQSIKWPATGLGRLLPIGLPIAFVVIGLLATLQGAIGLPNADALTPLISASITQTMPGLLVGLMFTGLALILLGKFQTSLTKAALVFCPLLVAILGYALTLVPTGAPLASVTGPQAGQRIAVINNAWSLGTAAPALLPPNTASLNRIHELGGYDSLLHRDTVALLNDINGQDSAPMANGNIMFIKPTFSASKLMEAGVTQIWSRTDIAGLGLAEEKDKYRIYALMGPGRASTPAGAAHISGETLSSLSLTATGPGRLIVRDRNMPGWSAKVDGKVTPIMGSTWREIDLSNGIHSVEMRYTPPGFTSGLIAFAFGVAICTGFCAFGPRNFIRNPILLAPSASENSQ